MALTSDQIRNSARSGHGLRFNSMIELADKLDAADQLALAMEQALQMASRSDNVDDLRVALTNYRECQ